ncbi:MAG: hypothetical protein ACRYFK_05415 [Janthinobacterium lividum]
MKITHRASADAAAALAPSVTALGPLTADKAPRLAVCCRLSELLPLVRQMHDAARDARQPDAGPAEVAA